MSVTNQQHIARPWPAPFTEAEREHVQIIQRRVAQFQARHKVTLPAGRTAQDLELDLAAVHEHAPLDLEGLASAEIFALIHDVGGIAYHLNRQTGELEGHFVPRYLARTRRTTNTAGGAS